MPYSKKGGKLKRYPGPTDKLRKPQKPVKTMRRKK